MHDDVDVAFGRSAPYSPSDQLFWPFRPQLNPVSSRYATRTAEFVFKNLTRAAPHPSGDALPFMTGTPSANTRRLSLDLYHPSTVTGGSARTPAPPHSPRDWSRVGSWKQTSETKCTRGSGHRCNNKQ